MSFDAMTKVEAGIVIYGMKVNDGLMYCGTEMQLFPAYSSLYFFLSPFVKSAVLQRLLKHKEKDWL